jgi:hypothetical protein
MEGEKLVNKGKKTKNPGTLASKKRYRGSRLQVGQVAKAVGTLRLCTVQY